MKLKQQLALTTLTQIPFVVNFFFFLSSISIMITIQSKSFFSILQFLVCLCFSLCRLFSFSPSSFAFIKKGLSLIRINKQLLKSCNKFFHHLSYIPIHSPLSSLYSRYQFSKWHLNISLLVIYSQIHFDSFKKPPFQSSSAFFHIFNHFAKRKTFIFAFFPL